MITFFADHSYIIYYLYKLGPFFLFFSLVFGIIGLPIPDELLLIGAGYLAAIEKLNPVITCIAAFSGSCCGITISFLIGRFIGMWVIKKYGKKFNITEKKVETAKKWFKSIGKWVLVIGYFIPLLRHLFGVIVGAGRLDYKQFALYAYTGALIWSLTFLSIGYFFHSFAKELFHR